MDATIEIVWPHDAQGRAAPAAPSGELHGLLLREGSVWVGGRGGVWQTPVPLDLRPYPQTGFRIGDDAVSAASRGRTVPTRFQAPRPAVPDVGFYGAQRRAHVVDPVKPVPFAPTWR